MKLNRHQKDVSFFQQRSRSTFNRTKQRQKQNRRDRTYTARFLRWVILALDKILWKSCRSRSLSGSGYQLFRDKHSTVSTLSLMKTYLRMKSNLTKSCFSQALQQVFGWVVPWITVAPPLYGSFGRHPLWHFLFFIWNTPAVESKDGLSKNDLILFFAFVAAFLTLLRLHLWRRGVRFSTKRQRPYKLGIHVTFFIQVFCGDRTPYKPSWLQSYVYRKPDNSARRKGDVPPKQAVTMFIPMVRLLS